MCLCWGWGWRWGWRGREVVLGVSDVCILPLTLGWTLHSRVCVGKRNMKSKRNLCVYGGVGVGGGGGGEERWY